MGLLIRKGPNDLRVGMKPPLPSDRHRWRFSGLSDLQEIELTSFQQGFLYVLLAVGLFLVFV